jgi:uncharacterized protein (DUF697 family)
VALPVRIGVLRGLAKEVSASSRDERPLAVGGVLAEVLAKELGRGGDPRAIRTGGPEGAAAYVYVLGDRATEQDEKVLKSARRGKVATIVVTSSRDRIPYVLATDVVPLQPGKPFPVERIATALAHRLGEDGTALAARLPVLRGPVCARLVAEFARKNGIVGAAVFVPGADLPLLLVNQLRLVLRIAAAYGQEIDGDRLPEVLATLGAGFAFRAVARELLGVVPVAGWAVKGGVAYAGTRALGEAAIRYFEARSPGSHVTPPRAGASLGAP